MWHVVRCYIAPDNASTIEIVVVVIIQSPQGEELLMASNFNTNVMNPEGNTLDEDVVSDLATVDMKDMGAYFLP